MFFQKPALLSLHSNVVSFKDESFSSTIWASWTTAITLGSSNACWIFIILFFFQTSSWSDKKIISPRQCLNAFSKFFTTPFPGPLIMRILGSFWAQFCSIVSDPSLASSTEIISSSVSSILARIDLICSSIYFAPL